MTIKELNQKLLNSAEVGDIDEIKLALQNGANVDAQDDYGNTALMWASYRNNRKIVELLIKEGANIESQDDYGTTALDIAKKNGYNEIVNLLNTKKS